MFRRRKKESMNTPVEVRFKCFYTVRENEADKNGFLQSIKVAACLLTLLSKVSAIYPNTL